MNTYPTCFKILAHRRKSRLICGAPWKFGHAHLALQE